MKYRLLALAALLCGSTQADAQVSIQIGMPELRVGIDLPSYPRLVMVPGYPVYYAPGLDSNYFFYDGLYWVYLEDRWYASDWYNGPWQGVAPEEVPLFVLRVPVRYYRRPPAYFRGWSGDAPPRWGHHWGRDWESHRPGWDRWDRQAAPPPAPLPVYQQRYAGRQYPRAVEDQRRLHEQHGRGQPGAAPAPRRQEPGRPEQRHQEPGRPEQRPQAAPQQATRPPPAPHQAAQPRPADHPGKQEERDQGGQRGGKEHDGGGKDKDKDKGQGKDRH